MHSLKKNLGVLLQREGSNEWLCLQSYGGKKPPINNILWSYYDHKLESISGGNFLAVDISEKLQVS